MANGHIEPSSSNAADAEEPVTDGTGSAQSNCCCCSVTTATQPALVQEPPSLTRPWIVGTLDTVAGVVPQVETRLRLADCLGAWRMRWGIGRTRYRIDPGLYAVGRPISESPVLVSANYKMSFDRLRSQLRAIDAWVLVLDTKGINVWCAAGKGSFGTTEIVNRVHANRLSELVSHRTLVVPQLSAPGVAAHQVKNRCGFRVVYGPVRAGDIPAFLNRGMKALPNMREVPFSLVDRLALVPVELMRWSRHAVIIVIAWLLLAGLGPDGYSWSRVVSVGFASAGLFLSVFVACNVLGPALLPWLPGRALSLKGAFLGIALILVLGGVLLAKRDANLNWPAVLGWTLLIPAIASFITMSFVGSTTYTSLSGVRREMWVAVPLQLAAAVAGAVLWLIGRFV